MQKAVVTSNLINLFRCAQLENKNNNSTNNKLKAQFLFKNYFKSSKCKNKDYILNGLSRCPFNALNEKQIK